MKRTNIVATKADDAGALEDLMSKTLEGIVACVRRNDLALVAPQALSFALAVLLDLKLAQPPSEKIEPGVNACCNMLQDRILMLTQDADPTAMGGA